MIPKKWDNKNRCFRLLLQICKHQQELLHDALITTTPCATTGSALVVCTQIRLDGAVPMLVVNLFSSQMDIPVNDAPLLEE